MHPPTSRAAGAAALALLAALAVAQAQPTAVRFQPAKKEADKKEPEKKEPEKKIEWPTSVGGKDIYAVMKDVEDHDPLVREVALNTLPLFGPPAQRKEVSQLLLRRMTAKDGVDHSGTAGGA